MLWGRPEELYCPGVLWVWFDGLYCPVVWPYELELACPGGLYVAGGA